MASTRRRPSIFCMNIAHLASPVYVARVQELWAAREVRATSGWDTEHLFNKCLQGTRSIDRAWGKSKARERKAHSTELQAMLARAQVALEGDPDDPGLQLAVQHLLATKGLNNFDKAKAQWVEHTIQAR